MVTAGLTGVYAETIPNFEVLTLVVFLSGVLLGARWGAMVGALSMLAYSLLNPYGPAHPLITLSQVTGELVAGPCGAALVAAGMAARPAAERAVVLAVAGALLTAWFDLLTNLATGLLFGQLRLTLIGGIPFALWHIGTNVALFAALGTPLMVVFARYRARLSS
ncbi:MAG: hypothetical protein HYR73_07820 [Candidatus Eisenbacteria bacterium]|nr:hypothetical protein [Candidatus Eisenbacteria bacterium]